MTQGRSARNAPLAAGAATRPASALQKAHDGVGMQCPPRRGRGDSARIGIAKRPRWGGHAMPPSPRTRRLGPHRHCKRPALAGLLQCRWADSNRRPPGYESSALNQLSYIGDEVRRSGGVYAMPSSAQAGGRGRVVPRGRGIPRWRLAGGRHTVATAGLGRIHLDEIASTGRSGKARRMPAATRPMKRGCGRSGRLVSSGWNCPPMK